MSITGFKLHIFKKILVQIFFYILENPSTLYCYFFSREIFSHNSYILFISEKETLHIQMFQICKNFTCTVYLFKILGFFFLHYLSSDLEFYLFILAFCALNVTLLRMILFYCED